MTTTALNTSTTIIREDDLVAHIKNILLFLLHHLFCPLKVTLIQLITIAVLPLTIYMLQLIGKFSSAAAIVAGILVILKVLIDLLTSSSHTYKTDQVLNDATPLYSCCWLSCCPFVRRSSSNSSLPSDTITCQHCSLNDLLTPEHMNFHYEPSHCK